MGHHIKAEKRRHSPTPRTPILVKKVDKKPSPKIATSKSVVHMEDKRSGTDDHLYSYSENTNCLNCFSKKMEINKLIDELAEVSERKEQLEKLLGNHQRKKKVSSKKVFKQKCSIKDKRSPSEHIISTCLSDDKEAKFYTGLPSVAHFELLYRFVYDKVKGMPYWRGRKNTLVNRIR